MRNTGWKALVCLAGLGVLNAGCGIVIYSTRNLVKEPCQVVDHGVAHTRDHVMACAAWKDFQKCHPGEDYSLDFARGFKAGFEDYIYWGGKGEPPLVPPQSYWKTKFQNPQGYAAVQDWFTGFRMGALAARQNGLREMTIIPDSLPPSDKPLPSIADIAPEGSTELQLPAPAREPIPLPKPAPVENAPAPLPQPAPEKPTPRSETRKPRDDSERKQDKQATKQAEAAPEKPAGPGLGVVLVDEPPR